MVLSFHLVPVFRTACVPLAMTDEGEFASSGGGSARSVGFGSPATVQAQKFSWTVGEDQAPAFETKRLEDVHGMRVRTALHTLAAMGSVKHQGILSGGRESPSYPSVLDIAKDLDLI